MVTKYLNVFAAALLAIILIGCAPREKEHALILNTSASARTRINPEDMDWTIKQVLLYSKFSGLRVLVTAEDPLEIHYSRSKGISSERILEDLDAERQRQTIMRTASLGGIRGDEWGFGTDHASAIRRLAASRIEGRTLVVTMITDGHNEYFDWSDFATALTSLMEKGPVKIIVLGVTQEVIEGEKKSLLIDRWRETFNDLQLVDLSVNPKAASGYYLSTRVILPRNLGI